MKRCFLFAMLALLLVSCNDKPKTLKPLSSKIEGPLAECFEVVVKDYPIIGGQVNVEFKKINDCLIDTPIVAEFLDDAGNVIASSKVNGNQKDLNFLLANKVGETSTIAFTIGNDKPKQARFSSSIPSEENNGESKIAIESEEVSIDVVKEESDTMIVIEEEVDEEGEIEDDEDEDDEDEITPQSVSSTSSKDWDRLLDDYESYVDQYIKLMKKASSGDLSAMTEYVSFLEKAEKLEEELNEAKNDLSVAQSQRLIKISKKMSNAALGM